MTTVLRTYVGLFLFLVAGLLLSETGWLSAMALAATTAVAAALMTCAVIASRTGYPLATNRVRTAIRDRERRTAFLAQRDPDAPGRARPRAPGRPLPTTAQALLFPVLA
ncbi:DUF6412 domain-containing protein [Streptomyces varsoviensis]|uniref:DUF6412 domain-containing protein n=1 Tax=Streptomyces varsoviensis TaxID=67373 RepID=UPI0004CA40BF|nr:DUF6412 domain-containing protein [Streptomyces varsoviensis]